MSSTQILKLIIKRSLFDSEKQDHKFIFVGAVPHHLHLILEKFCGDLIVDEESFSRLKILKEDSKARWIERRSTL